ncbi:divalent cation tolerance protein [Izhakiella capsodis]|uniref:Divalent-cation tolerance protein CutA n=1 Tax=Izhakiella capsodis TaxID=1367852 RepID=A0A1I4VQJ7_9GAMM|nr:divalent cation tolerance protein CutA [Izhakiella capsodis]SFN03571.1 divalent cation tolerance protein [Izhakiella capsodis]
MACSQAVIVLCTTPDDASARTLADSVLSAKLAACVTVLPGATSLYIWQGKLAEASEVQLLLKSDSDHLQALFALIKKQHPYDTPELLAIPVLHGESDYLSWLTASLR